MSAIEAHSSCVVYAIEDDRWTVIVRRSPRKQVHMESSEVRGHRCPAGQDRPRWMSSPWCSIASNGRRLVAEVCSLETITDLRHGACIWPSYLLVEPE